MRVCGKDPDQDRPIHQRQLFLNQDRNGVRFFSRRAARDPDAKLLIIPDGFQQARQLFARQQMKGLAVSKELRDSDQQILVKLIQLRTIVGQQFHILLDAHRIIQQQPSLNAPRDGARLVVTEVDAILFPQHAKDGPQTHLRNHRLRLTALLRRTPHAHQFQDRVRHFRWRQDQIHKPRFPRAARHSVEPRGLFALSQHQSAGIMDVTNSA